MDADPPAARLKPHLSNRRCEYYSCMKPHDHRESIKFCSGCRKVSYCSPECQKKDWKDHKPNCKYDKLEYDYGTDLERKISVEYSFFISTTSDELVVAARSAFRIGKRDSLIDSHFFRIDVRYVGKNDHSPPEVEDPVKVRKKFKVLRLTVEPRTSFDQQPWDEGSHPEIPPGASRLWTLYLLEPRATVGRARFCAMCIILLRQKYDLLWDSRQRQLNADWEADLLSGLAIYDTGEEQGGLLKLAPTKDKELVRELALTLNEAKKIETDEVYRIMQSRYVDYFIERLILGTFEEEIQKEKKRNSKKG